MRSIGFSGIPVVGPLLKTRYPHPCRSARAIHGPQRFSKVAQPQEFRKSRSIHRSISISLAFLVLIACSSSEDELIRYIQSVKNRPAKPIEPIPSFKPLEQFIFPENDTRRSPFKPIQHDNQADIDSPNMNRPKQPLEAFPLDALQFVGILKEDRHIWGLMMQPGGLVTRVKEGDYMGKNYGQIQRIKNNAIEIEEAVQVAGKWEKRKVTLNLHGLD